MTNKSKIMDKNDTYIDEEDITREIYQHMLKGNFKFRFIGNINRHPHDIVSEYFVIEHSKFIEYDADNDDKTMFNWYKNYFKNSCKYTGEFNYKFTLNLLIKHYSKKHIFKFHNDLMDYFKNEVYTQSELTTIQFMYLTHLYDTQFKRRITEEINNINFTFLLICDSLDEEAIDEIKEEYKCIEVN